MSSLLSDEKVLIADFYSGLELLNFQDDSKVELIFSRLLEHETRIRSKLVPDSPAFSQEEKQKLKTVLNNIQSEQQVTCIFYLVPFKNFISRKCSLKWLNGLRSNNIFKIAAKCVHISFTACFHIDVSVYRKFKLFY
jgi:hypothetical protein